MPERQIAVADRVLTVYDEGDPGAPAIVVHHGTPGAGPVYDGCVRDARERGARLVAFDRAGYGASTPAPGRTVGDVAADVTAILDALEIERCAGWGISGGGPHALACAARLGDRVAATASLAGVVPFDAPGINYFAGMGEDNLVEFGLALAGRDHLAAFIDAAVADMLGHLDDLAQTVQTLVSQPDRVALGGPIGEWWAAGLARSFSHGPGGWIDDDLAFVRPFGFALETITTPTLIVHGHEDRFVPPSHGRWLAQAVPGAEAWLLAGEAHMSLLANRIGDVHAWLLDHLAR